LTKQRGDLENKRDELKGKINDLEQQIKGENDAKAILQKMYDALPALQKAGFEGKTLKDAIAKIDADIEVKKADKAKLEKELGDVRDKISDINNKIADLKDKKNDCACDVEGIIGTNADLVIV
jgi:chromosome segregation ATPase